MIVAQYFASKSRVPILQYGKNYVVLALAVSLQYIDEIHTQTNGQTRQHRKNCLFI